MRFLHISKLKVLLFCTTISLSFKISAQGSLYGPIGCIYIEEIDYHQPGTNGIGINNQMTKIHVKDNL